MLIKLLIIVFTVLLGYLMKDVVRVMWESYREEHNATKEQK